METLAKKHKYWCRKCHSVDNLSVSATPLSTAGHKNVYYMCRRCNTEHCKAYRQTTNGRKKTNEAVYRSIKKYPHKQKARLAVRYALRCGKLEKSDCKCGSHDVEAHHDDYTKPLEVLWLCRSCHSQTHKMMVQ